MIEDECDRKFCKPSLSILVYVEVNKFYFDLLAYRQQVIESSLAHVLNF